MEGWQREEIRWVPILLCLCILWCAALVCWHRIFVIFVCFSACFISLLFQPPVWHLQTLPLSSLWSVLSTDTLVISVYVPSYSCGVLSLPSVQTIRSSSVLTLLLPQRKLDRLQNTNEQYLVQTTKASSAVGWVRVMHAFSRLLHSYYLVPHLPYILCVVNCCRVRRNIQWEFFILFVLFFSLFTDYHKWIGDVCIAYMLYVFITFESRFASTCHNWCVGLFFFRENRVICWCWISLLASFFSLSVVVQWG